MRWAVVLLALFLAGCAGTPNTPAGRCRAAAEHDPTVHGLEFQQLGSQFPIQGLAAKLAAARARAIAVCLQRQGGGTGTGVPEVEPVRPAY